MHVWYNWRVIMKIKFHSKFYNWLIKWEILIAKIRRFSTCILNVSFRSIHTFSHLIIFWNFKIVPFDRIIELVNMIFFDSKWINSNFESSNCIAFASVHENAILIISISVLQLFSMFFDETLICISSIKLKELIRAFIRIFENKNRIYMKNRIGEIDDFCDMSVFIWRVCCFWPSNANAIERLFMKLLTQFFSYMNKFNLMKIINNWFVKTWSNAFLTFKNKHNVINFCFKINWILCVKLNIASIADQFFRLSIWSKSNIFEICLKYDNRLTMIFFEIFFKQFSNVMIRYDFDIK